MDLDAFYQAMVLTYLRMTRRTRAAITSPQANLNCPDISLRRCISAFYDVGRTRLLFKGCQLLHG